MAVTQAPQLQQANRAPTVASALGDATIVNESRTQEVSLSGVFSDPDDDALTITASSSDDATATASVTTDQSSLTVTAKSKGTATITVTADDGNGGTVEDTFAVTVKAAPVVAIGLADVSGLEAGATQDMSLSRVFSDADGDALTITAIILGRCQGHRNRSSGPIEADGGGSGRRDGDHHGHGPGRRR